VAAYYHKSKLPPGTKSKIIAGIAVLALTVLLAGCNQQGEAAGSPELVPRSATVELPTPKPTVTPAPTNTRVLPLEVLTPPAAPSITPIPDEARALVVDVIDGDTIVVVMDGDPARQAYQVRYLGVDAPENSSATPWGVVAYETNRRLTNLKVVRLVRDQTDFDDEGNLLRYVYLDNQLMSSLLAEQGLVRAAVEAPDDQFAAEIQAAEAQAREASRGIWGQRPPTPTPGPAAPQPGPATATPAAAPATTETEPTEEITEEATTEPAPAGTEEGTAEPATTGTPESQ
jgi:micrococcal nuclease